MAFQFKSRLTQRRHTKRAGLRMLDHAIDRYVVHAISLIIVPSMIMASEPSHHSRMFIDYRKNLLVIPEIVSVNRKHRIVAHQDRPLVGCLKLR